MSYKTPSKTSVVKLSVSSPSYQEMAFKTKSPNLVISTKSNTDAMTIPKSSALASPSNIKIQLQSPTSTALTRTKPPSPTSKQNQALRNAQTPKSVKSVAFSRRGTSSVEKSAVVVQEPEPKSPPVKARRPSYIEELGMSTSEVKERIYKIFQFYTSFGERSNPAYLKSHRFTKMMVDAEIRSLTLTQSSLDLLFVGELKHNGQLDFDRFLSLLGKVAVMKYDEVPEAEALELLLKENMFPLYDKIYKDIGPVDDSPKIDEIIQESTKMVLDLAEGALESIYRMYFPFEIQTDPDPQVVKQRLENALFIFLREFNICPGLIHKGTAYAIWNEILKLEIATEAPEANDELEQTRDRKSKTKRGDKNKNLPFSFERFKLFLMRVANFGFQDQLTEDGKKCNQPERMIQLLERMDMAFRVLNSDKKAASLLGGKSLIVSKESLEKIYNYLRAKEEKESIASGKPGAEVIITSGTKYETYNITDTEVIRLYERFHHSLLKIFQFYCSFGEPLNTTKLHAFKFNKLIKEAGLFDPNNGFLGSETSFKILSGVPSSNDVDMIGLTGADADIVVASLTGPKQIREINEKKINYDPSIETPFLGFLNYLYKNNPLNLAVQGRLEFEAFLKAVEMVGQKVYPNYSAAKAVNCILERNLLRLEKEIDQIQKMVGSAPLKSLVDVLKDMYMVEFLGLVHKVMTVYYGFYSDAKGMMNIERFMQFCKDFGIFPALVPKGKLCTFFHALAGVRSRVEENNMFQANLEIAEKSSNTQKVKKPTKAIGQQEDDLIDQHMFIEALTLCALEVPYLNPQPSDMQKVYNMLEKINQSQGPTIIKMRLGVTRLVSGSSWDIMHEIRAKYPELVTRPLDDEELHGVIQNTNEQNSKK